MTSPGAPGPETFLFLHAHPDDESIFTGGTIARLARAGHRCVVVLATSGEAGRGAGPELGHVRQAEARLACEVLGAARLILLDHRDSGLSSDPRQQPWGAFAAAQEDVVAAQLADVVRHEGVSALITYDSHGIYGHPDHIHVHRVGARTAEMAGLESWYEATIDREYLHFVDVHVTAIAGEAISAISAGPPLGSATVEITTVVNVQQVLAEKYAAIAAHRSQIDGDPGFGSGDRFSEVYGYEWYIRHGPPTAIESLDASSPVPYSSAGSVTPGRRSVDLVAF